MKAPLVQAHWRTRILRWRSSTARFANDYFHRRSPSCPWSEPLRRHWFEPPGEGRSAGFWRSHHRRITPSRLWSVILNWHRIGPSRINWTWPPSRRLSMAAEAAMARARYGIVRAMPLNRWRAGPHRRGSHDIARCTVERLMKVMGLQGVVRGKKVITTNPDTAQPCPDDKVNRAFVADMPNQLWGRPLRRHWFKPNGRRFHLCLQLAGHGLCRHSSGKQRPTLFSDPPHSSTSSPAKSSVGASRPR